MVSENWSPNGGTVHSGNLFRRAVPVVSRPKCHLLCNLSSETLLTFTKIVHVPSEG